MRETGLGILFLLLTGCASQSLNRPAWVLNPQEKYPEAQYLVAVGEGDTRRAAENSAAGGMARIFESNVQAEETLSETTTEARGALDSFDQLSELRANIRVGSKQNLLNIQFGEAFTDPHGRVHAAAILPRAETAEIYRTRIGENSRTIVHLIYKSDTSSEPLEKYAFRRAAVRKALENDRLLAQLDIILPGLRARLATPYDSQSLYSETAEAAQDVTFSIQLPGEGGDALREALTGMGFSESDNAVLRFSGSASVEKTDLRRGTLVFVRTRYRLETHTRDQSLVLSLSGSHREGHINFEQATARAQRSLRDDLLTNIPKKVGGYLDRLASSQ
jgi:hypothetical protein